MSSVRPQTMAEHIIFIPRLLHAHPAAGKPCEVICLATSRCWTAVISRRVVTFPASPPCIRIRKRTPAVITDERGVGRDSQPNKPSAEALLATVQPMAMNDASTRCWTRRRLTTYISHRLETGVAAQGRGGDGGDPHPLMKMPHSNTKYLMIPKTAAGRMRVVSYSASRTLPYCTGYP